MGEKPRNFILVSAVKQMWKKYQMHFNQEDQGAILCLYMSIGGSKQQ